jgi:hypothetical protein
MVQECRIKESSSCFHHHTSGNLYNITRLKFYSSINYTSWKAVLFLSRSRDKLEMMRIYKALFGKKVYRRVVYSTSCSPKTG